MMRGQQNSQRPDSGAILVTGGSGFIGKRLVAKLAEQGSTVVCMYHHRLPEPMANVYPVCSDMASSDLIAAPLRGVDTVVHLAWEDTFIGPTEKVSWNLNSDHLPKNVLLLKNLINAMERAGTKRIVFLSAMGSGRHAQAAFLQEKYLAEFFILNSKIPEKIILRTSIVCGGENDRFLKSIVRVMQFPGFYPVPPAADLLAPIHISDITDVLSSLARAKDMESPNGLLEVSGKESLAVDELFKLVSERYARGSKIPLRGFLGASLLPFFERDSKHTPHMAKLRHYLTIGNRPNQVTAVHNPLAKLVPEINHGFRDVLGEGTLGTPELAPST